MVAISSLCVFLFVFTLRPGTGKKNLADEKIFIYQYFFFFSIFTTVPLSLEAFKCPPVSYVDLNETELGFTA